LKDSYSDTGRPSIDPELLLRILLIGYLYGVTSERKLVEELQMHLAWRWFTGLSFDQEIPHHSMPEAAHVKRTVREYLADLEQENPVEEAAPQQDQVSTTDPDSTYATKGKGAAELGYFNNYLIDNQSCVILGVQATTARLSQESAAAREMITRSAERRGRFPQSIAADTTYGNGELLAWFEERDITPYIRVKESPAPKTNLYGIEKFLYDPETNSYQCPAGKRLTYLGVNPRNRNHIYRATRKRCRECAHKLQCTTGHYRQIAIHVHEAARQRARERATVPAFAAAQRQRRKVEALFAELKNQIGLRRVRLRRIKHVREQFFLAATAQNLKRLARFLRSRSLESATVPI